MPVAHADPTAAKGWCVGPWNSDVAIGIGYANEGIDDPHPHAHVTEIYLVARGEAEARIERDTLTLGPGDVLIVEPGEAHTFLANSPDYLHFVVHVPGLPPGEAPSDRMMVPRSRLV